jgi:hypothetical protein
MTVLIPNTVLIEERILSDYYICENSTVNLTEKATGGDDSFLWRDHTYIDTPPSYSATSASETSKGDLQILIKNFDGKSLILAEVSHFSFDD